MTDNTTTSPDDSFQTADGLTLRTRTWFPENAPRANVVLIHGYGDHCGRYHAVAQALNAEDLAVFSYDQRGFGRSEGRRGYIAAFDPLLDDLDRFIETRPEELGNRPTFMMGQSFGGLLAARYGETRRPDCRGMVLCSPFLGFPENVPKPLLSLARVLGVLTPWLPVSKVDAQGLSRIREVVAAADSDPLSYHGFVHARTGAQMQAAIEATQADAPSLTLPVYIIHGDADAIVPISGSRAFFDACGAEDKTLNVYEGGYHELWQDLEQDRVMAGIIDWIAKRL